MVVIAIIGIFAAIVVPRTGVMSVFQLRASARNLVGTIRLTYSTAVVNRSFYRICFDLEEQVYWVEKKEGDQYVKVEDPLLGERVLPDEVYFKRIEAADRVCDYMCQEYLYFTPGGYVEAAAVYLTLEEGSPVISVFTRPMIGKAVIVMEEISREEWEEAEEME